jgi:hypothetical protein
LILALARFCLANEITLSGVLTGWMKTLVVDERVPHM